MSRDQKPGKVKLVAGSAQNFDRRIGDQNAGGPGAPQDIRGMADPATGATLSTPRRLLPALLFLVCCAAGGSGAVAFGLVEGLSQ